MGIFEKVLERHLSREDIYHRSRVCKLLASKMSIDKLLDNLERPLPENLSDVYGWRHSYLPREQRFRWNPAAGKGLRGTLSDNSSATFSNDSGYYKQSSGTNLVTNTNKKNSHTNDSAARSERRADKDMPLVLSADSGFSTSSYETLLSDTDKASNAHINITPSKRSIRTDRTPKNNRKEAFSTRQVTFSEHMPMNYMSRNSENEQNRVEGKCGLSKKTMSLQFDCTDNSVETSPGMTALAEIRQGIAHYVDHRTRWQREKRKNIGEIETKYRFPAVTKVTQGASTRKINTSHTSTSPSESRRHVPNHAETPSSRKAQRPFASYVRKEDSGSHRPPCVFDEFTKNDKQFLPLEPTFPRKFADDPPEFQQFSSHVMEVILHFDPRETKSDTGEFPFKTVLEETSVHEETVKYIQSLNTAIQIFGNEKLEIHGSLPWNDTKQTLKFILVVLPEVSTDGRTVTYKGTYRRQMKPDAQFMTWRFRI